MSAKLLFAYCCILLTAISACEKKATLVNCELVEVVRLRSDCDRIIFKIASGNFTGDASWTDLSTGKTHTNVVAMINPCRFNTLPYPEIQRRDTFFVKIEQLPNSAPPITTANCVQCFAVSQNPPIIQVDFPLIETSTCEF
jgi:hypothetical protein